MKKINILFLFASVLLFVSINIKGQVINDQKEFEKYLADKEKQYEEISVYFGTQTWNLYSMEGKADLSGAKEKYAALFNDSNLENNISEWNKKLANSSDDVLKRRLQIWKTMFTAAKVDLNPEVAKMSASLQEAIRNRDAKNTQLIKELETKVLDLMKLRNKIAQRCGYNSYPEFILELTGLGYEWFNNFVDELDRRTAPVYKEIFEKIKNEKGKVGMNDLRAHQKYIRDPNFSNDSLYLLMKESLGAIGIDYEKLPIRFVVKEADFGGNCIAVSIPEDLRVIMVPDMPISVYLHELGHGMQWMKTSINIPSLEGYEWCIGNGGPAFTEGMAETLANFCRHPLWYKKYTKLSDEEIAKQLTPDKFGEAIRIRRTFVNFLVEIELYKNPDKDISQIFTELINKYLWIDDFKLQRSIAETLYIDYPCYLHNYLLADIIGWQVHDTLRQKFGDGYVFNNQVGQFLIDNLYKNGMLKDWQGIIKGATGNNLDVDGYLKSRGM